jgi:hypothetical protein
MQEFDKTNFSPIEQEFESYGRWRESLKTAITDFRTWLFQQELSDAQTDQRMGEILSTLEDNRLYIAFVAEFSRGKSELINAIFFSRFGQRVLPSAAGRTTMCPTELVYDAQHEHALRLLPIETRNTGTTIAEYKGMADEWTSLPLDIENPEQVSEVLSRITDIKEVSKQEAQELGLHIATDEAHEDGMHITESGNVEIPAWRHAIINYPHPLLEAGLVILDTPGLNALGAEPELTLNLLASAHAVLFILAADAGVTKSDMGVWRDHISTVEEGPGKGTLVVLNKIDVLWDELRDQDEVEREVQRQIEDTAKTLNVSDSQIFPVSAQKALLGKVRGNQDILRQSRITELEDALAEVIIPAKREIVRDNVQHDVSEIIKAMRTVIVQRVNGVQDHINELAGLNSKNVEVIEDMMQKVKEDKEHLEKNLQRFYATRSIFSQQTNMLYTHLNMNNLSSLIAETKKDMSVSLTTNGLRSSMVKFFARARKAMEEVGTQAKEIRELMEGVYRKFQDEHGLVNVKPGGFSATKYLRALKAIETKHDMFLKGMSLALTEQMNVVNTFFESAVAKVREVFDQANRDADTWLKTIMSPMEAQVREHQVQLRRRLESIKRIHKATDSLEDRLNELKHVKDGFRDQSKEMEDMINQIMAALAGEAAQAEESGTSEDVEDSASA